MCFHIAGLHGHEVADGFFTEGVFKRTDESPQFDRIVVADIVDTPRRGAGRRVGLGAVHSGSGWGMRAMTRITPR